MSDINKLTAEAKELRTYLRDGGILVDLLHELIDEDTMLRLLTRYQQLWADVEGAQEQLESAIEAEKLRVRAAAFEAYKAGGDTRYRDGNAHASVRLSTSYDPIEASAILRDHALYEQALADGVIVTEEKVVKSRVKGKYKDLLKDASVTKVSSVVVKVGGDTDDE